MEDLRKLLLDGPQYVADLPSREATELQQALTAAGYELVDDGIPGAKTQEAWADFKREAAQAHPKVIGLGSLSLLEYAVAAEAPAISAAVEAAKDSTPLCPAPHAKADSTEATQPDTTAPVDKLESLKEGIIEPDDESAQPDDTQAVEAEEKPEPEKPKRISKMIPSGGAVFVDEPITAAGNFTWSEFTAGGTRWPQTIYHENNIRRIAGILEEARALLGNVSIRITSGFRPGNDPWLGDVNAAVGGARFSRHKVGDAVDFWVPSMSIVQAYDTLLPWCKEQGIAIAISYRDAFIHMDDRGYFESWTYN